MAERVCAVIVTHNRRDLLRECLQAALGQTLIVDEILVVNNASTDSTQEMLAADFPQVKVLCLPEDTGSAGGFHEGMKWAYEHCFDWIWTMDDDAMPDPECIQRLLSYNGTDLLIIRYPLELNKEGSGNELINRLIYQGRLMKTATDAQLCADNGVLMNVSGTANGRLVHWSVVEKIGLPQKEFFMYYDDTEYDLRARRAGIKFGGIVKAFVYHPATYQKRLHTIKILGIKFSVQHTGVRFLDYLLVRNGAYITRHYGRYGGLPAFVAYCIKYFIFYFSRNGLRPALRSVQVAWKGAWGDFSHLIHLP
jgi:rhamnopyranosyl-N-acetylglucosaminyl-diphospho-decaprenol beta-1,3/1,4-galactofuranosyltransferase